MMLSGYSDVMKSCLMDNSTTKIPTVILRRMKEYKNFFWCKSLRTTNQDR